MAYILINYAWVSADASSPVFTNLVYYTMSQEYLKNLIDGDFFNFLTNMGNFYPPLPYQITALVYLLFGQGAVQSVMSQWIFWVILIIGTFLLTEHLLGCRWGAAAAVITACIPQTAFYSRTVGVDIPTAAFVPLCLYFLFKSENFQKIPETMGFFITLALGMLCKWVFAVYVIIPGAFCFYQALKSDLKDKQRAGEVKRFLVQTGVFLVLFCIIGFFAGSDADLMEILYYLFLVVMVGLFIYVYFRTEFSSPRIRGLTAGLILLFALTAHFSLVHAFSLGEIYRVWFWGVQHNLLLEQRTPYNYFILYLIFRNFGLLFFTLFAAGMGVHFSSGKKRHELTLMAGITGFSLLFFYFQPVYDSRYFIPLNPIASVFIVYLIYSIPRPFLRRVLMAITGIFCLYYLAGWTFTHRNILPVFMGSVTESPKTAVCRLDEGADYLLSLFRKEPAGSHMLVMVQDDSEPDSVTPLLIFYYLRKNLDPIEKIAMIFDGPDPVFPCKDKPWGYFLTECAGDDDEGHDRGFYLSKKLGGSGDPGGEQGNIFNRMEEASLGKVRADAYYGVRIRDPGDSVGLPHKLTGESEGRFDIDSVDPINSIMILDDAIMDIYEFRRNSYEND